MELGGGQVLTRGERKEWSGRKTRSLMGGAGGAQNKADWGGLRPGRAQASDGVGGSPCDVPLCSCVFGVMASRTGRICFGRVCFGF